MVQIPGLHMKLATSLWREILPSLGTKQIESHLQPHRSTPLTFQPYENSLDDKVSPGQTWQNGRLLSPACQKQSTARILPGSGLMVAGC